jgi:diguanylate cyclase (GGDEF)-like protein
MKTLRLFAVPGGVLLLSIAILDSFGWITLAPPSLKFLVYCALLGGMLLAWRFHSSRIFLTLLVLFLSHQAIGLFGGGQHPLGSAGIMAVRAVSIIVPLNYILIAVMRERGFVLASAGPAALILFVESVTTVVLCRGAEGPYSAPLHPHHSATVPLLTNYSVFVFIAGFVFLLVRFLAAPKLADSALVWSLAAFFVSLKSTGNWHSSILYLTTGACILAISIVENSYLLAYHDELTSLPSRRAFNDAMLRLQNPYSIAVVDIDHFKRFNDTYGHDVGDDVLRLVASRLSCVTGGGQAYRCGGEEFMILFPGRITSEVVDHLDRLRRDIESSEFRVRAADRRHSPRGSERRNVRTSAVGKGHAIRQLARQTSPIPVSVTVSIGVATSAAENPDREVVLQSADKALYRAKANGRNRLETATAKRRSGAKSAGIA